MSATSAANKSAFSLITQKGIPSGPDALFVLNPDSLMTENSDIGQGCSCWCTYSVGIFPLFGKVLEVCDGVACSTFEKPLSCSISFHNWARTQALRSLTWHRSTLLDTLSALCSLYSGADCTWPDFCWSVPFSGGK